jgi:4-hydroxybenzoate polyprenyltransferase
LAFAGVLCIYLLATFAYSLWLKRKLVIDVLTLAALYTTRIIAGAAAGSILISPWFLSFSMFLFLALAAVKRQAELIDQMSTDRGESGRAYQVDDLPVLRAIAISSGQTAVMVLALYISSDDVQQLYNRPEVLWLICPVLLYWMLRMVMKTHRGMMTDDPIVYAATDAVSRVLIGFSFCLVILATL